MTCLPACRASMVPGLTNTNATLTAENSRLNDRMAGLVQDLTEENRHLLDENERLNHTVQKVHFSSRPGSLQADFAAQSTELCRIWGSCWQADTASSLVRYRLAVMLEFPTCTVLQVLSENAELSSRLIDVALTSDNDVFEAAFGEDVSSNDTGMATVPLGHWSQEATQKRRQEAQEEVCCLLSLALLTQDGCPARTCTLHVRMQIMDCCCMLLVWAAGLAAERPDSNTLCGEDVPVSYTRLRFS